MQLSTRAVIHWMCLGLYICAVDSARADVRLAGVFGDHMVLQRNSRANLWGQASPGELIRVRPSWYERDAAVTAGPDGSFSVSLTTPGDPGPHTIRFSASNEVVLNDVLLGEVWLASGQSNMEMGVGGQGGGYGGVLNWQQELADAERPRVRLFTVRNTAAAAAVADVSGSWSTATSTSVSSFSACGWFFARQLERDLDVPIGVIAADWGGTPAEAWTSAHGLANFPQYKGTLEKLAGLAADGGTAAVTHASEQKIWGRTLAAKDPLSAAHAEAAGFDDSAWGTSVVPATWSGDLARFDGILWMRRSVEIPRAWAGRALELSLGTIDDDDWTWFNGELVGSTAGWDVERKYKITPPLEHGAQATIAVRILDTGGEGGLRSAASSIWLGVAGTRERISLTGEWKIARGSELSALPPKPVVLAINGHTPSALFNGMIAPLRDFRIAGAIWYQGESNVGRAEEYTQLFPALIEDWRAHFGFELPFLYVQIAPFAYGRDNGQAGDLRAAQAAALSLPRTGMVCTLDIGDPADIHPKNKQAVGERLARIALHDVYNVGDAPPPPPIATAARREGSRIWISFDRQDLTLCGPSAFEVCGEDGIFKVAPLVELAGERQGGVLQVDGLMVECPEVSEPHQVRYAWRAAASPSICTSDARLPIEPFWLGIP